jgi:hypothetical protein
MTWNYNTIFTVRRELTLFFSNGIFLLKQLKPEYMATGKVFTKEKRARSTAYDLAVSNPQKTLELIEKAIVEKFALTHSSSGQTVSLYRYGAGTRMFVLFLKKPAGFAVILMHNEPAGGEKLNTTEEELEALIDKTVTI